MNKFTRVLLFIIIFSTIQNHSYGSLPNGSKIPFSEQILNLFPDRFTQQELDDLRDGKSVLRGDLLFSMDGLDAAMLANSYPMKGQIFSAYSFTDRVKKQNFFQIPDEYSIKVLYRVESPYIKYLNDTDGFFVKVERVVDSFTTLLNSELDPENQTTLIIINEFNDVFINQTVGHGFQRIITNLSILTALLEKLNGESFNGTKMELIEHGDKLLIKYIAEKKIFENSIVDIKTINAEQAIVIAEALKEDIFKKIGVDPKNLPDYISTQMFLYDKGLLGNINHSLLAQRFNLGDPSIIKARLLDITNDSIYQTSQSTKIDILNLFPDIFSQEELDQLKAQHPVFHGNYAFSLDESNAEKLADNYPYKFQLKSKGNFPDRVIKSGITIIESNKIAYANYIVKSPYVAIKDDTIGFNVKIEHVIDANVPLLGFSMTGEDLDSQKSTTLIQIKELNESFVRGNGKKKGNGYDKRLNDNLTKFLLLTKKLNGMELDSSYADLMTKGQQDLRQYIAGILHKDVAVDKGVLMEEQDFYRINDILKTEIYNLLGIDPAVIPNMEDYFVNFLATKDDEWLADITSIPLEKRLMAQDPGLIRINLL
jgi:hypothetical protein